MEGEKEILRRIVERTFFVKIDITQRNKATSPPAPLWDVGRERLDPRSFLASALEIFSGDVRWFFAPRARDRQKLIWSPPYSGYRGVRWGIRYEPRGHTVVQCSQSDKSLFQCKGGFLRFQCNVPYRQYFSVFVLTITVSLLGKKLHRVSSLPSRLVWITIHDSEIMPRPFSQFGTKKLNKGRNPHFPSGKYYLSSDIFVLVWGPRT